MRTASALFACSVILLSSLTALAEDWYPKPAPSPLPNPNQSSQANIDALASQGVTCAKPNEVKPPVKPKKPTGNKFVPKPTPKPVLPPPCVCEDKKCDVCPAPVVVTKVETKTVYVDRPVLVKPAEFVPRFAIGAGWMMAAAVPAHVYMWQQGPQLELRYSMTPRLDAFLDLGMGLGASDLAGPGKRKSFVAQAGLDGFSKRHPWVGLSGSLYASNVGFRTANGLDSETYLGVVPALAFRTLNKRVNVYFHAGLLIGAGIGDTTQLAVGPVANAMLLFR